MDMKTILGILLISLVTSLASSAQRGGEKAKTLTTGFERIEVIHMPPGTDMLEGFREAIEEKGIKNGVILAGIGSVTDYHYHVVTSKTLPPDEEFPKASVAMDLTSLQGYILDGRVHAHMTLSDENSVIGGHVEPGTKALTFFVITVGVLPDSIDISRIDRTNY